jgi:hypothetical protein
VRFYWFALGFYMCMLLCVSTCIACADGCHDCETAGTCLPHGCGGHHVYDETTRTCKR